MIKKTQQNHNFNALAPAPGRWPQLQIMSQHKARPCAQTLKPTRCFKRFKLQEATPLRLAKKANDPLLKLTCDHPTLHKCSMTTNLPVTRKEPGHYCYKTTGIQSVCRFYISANTMTRTKILVQKLRSTSCEQCLDRFHRTLHWKSTSA
jgi:hypothetical protein